MFIKTNKIKDIVYNNKQITMTLRIDFSERSEREIKSKEKANANQPRTTQKNCSRLIILYSIRQVKILDTI